MTMNPIPHASGRLRVVLALIGGMAICVSTGSLAASDSLQLDRRASRLPFTHQGPFVSLPDGKTILTVDSEHCLTSRDGGATWQTWPLFSTEQQAKFNLQVSNERTVLCTSNGTVIVGFMNLNERKWTWSDELHDAPGAILPTYVMRSVDAGRTWTDIRKLHDSWTGAVRDSLQSRSGRIVISTMKMLHNPGRHGVLTYGSHDDGRTWEPSHLIDLGGRGHHGGATEGTFVELQDGRLWMLIRTNHMQFWSAYSKDAGRTWSELCPSKITASSAPGMLARLASGRLVLLWNRPYPDGASEFPLQGGDGLWSDVPVSNHRAELSIAFSGDEGQSWTDPVVLARLPKKWVAYPYVFEPQPGQLWITTMQSDLRVAIREGDFVP